MPTRENRKRVKRMQFGGAAPGGGGLQGLEELLRRNMMQQPGGNELAQLMMAQAGAGGGGSAMGTRPPMPPPGPPPPMAGAPRMLGGIPGLPPAESPQQRQQNMDLAAMQQAGALPTGPAPLPAPGGGPSGLPLPESEARRKIMEQMANPGRVKAGPGALRDYGSNAMMSAGLGGLAGGPVGMGVGAGAGLLAAYLKRRDKKATGGVIGKKAEAGFGKKDTPKKETKKPPSEKKPPAKRMAMGGVAKIRKGFPGVKVSKSQPPPLSGKPIKIRGMGAAKRGAGRAMGGL